MEGMASLTGARLALEADLLGKLRNPTARPKLMLRSRRARSGGGLGWAGPQPLVACVRARMECGLHQVELGFNTHGKEVRLVWTMSDCAEAPISMHKIQGWEMAW